MLRNRIYYAIKPLVPLGKRRAIRRWFALRKRQRVGNVWPILPGSERPPEGWPGWPDGKKFALVLTHDVEGPAGLAKCRQLMELQRDLGFRSCFNFIPEGDYRVTEDLRTELVRNGFEVGVHDLHHDGKLFRSRREFVQNAVRINHYLKTWGAVGFRAGFMLHNLDWIGDLNVQYDLSTFDTDPFEPQPDNVGTIFPFWVERRGEQERREETKGAGGRNQETGGRGQGTGVRSQETGGRGQESGGRPSAINHPSDGYLELPYTLPQDSTLYLLFQERHPDIWFQKLDWVARHGGMALVNVHPDYVQFPGQPPSEFTFPAEIYSDFLKYARQRYGDSFWQPLPGELAAWAGRHKPELRRKPKRVCLAGALFYESDTRTKRYAEALKERGDHVDVLALRRPGQPKRETINGINVFRIQERVRNERGVLSYLRRLSLFLVKSFWVISRQHLRQRYDFVHIHSIPDFEVFAALIPKLTGAKILLDVYDVLPEFYLSKFHKEKPDVIFRLLLAQERLSARFAHHVISANHLWQKKLTSRAVPVERCTPFVNYIDTQLFLPHPRNRRNGSYTVVYPGVLNWHQGVDITIRAFKIFSDSVPSAEYHIYGDGPEKERLLQLITDLGLCGRVLVKDPVPLVRIPQILADADMGVVGKRADVFGNEAYSTKILEYMSQGLPVVVPRTAIDSFYFGEDEASFYRPADAEDMAAKMLRLYRDPQLRETFTRNGLECVRRNSWQQARKEYLALVDRLVGHG